MCPCSVSFVLFLLDDAWHELTNGGRSYGQHLFDVSCDLFHLIYYAVTHAYTEEQVGFGAVITVFGPSSPPVVPTPENVLKAATESECNGLICVPSFLEVNASSRSMS